MSNYELLMSYSKEELIKLLENSAKNLLAMDGVWFQSIEKKDCMQTAMLHDIEAWRKYTVSEARRIKEFLGLDEHPGLEGLEKALRLRFAAYVNQDRIEIDGNTLTYTLVTCRVQNARARKGMPYHPCKSVGIVEFSGFAKTIDSRFSCRCLSCYPEITDGSCCCKWKFILNVDVEK